MMGSGNDKFFIAEGDIPKTFTETLVSSLLKKNADTVQTIFVQSLSFLLGNMILKMVVWHLMLLKWIIWTPSSEISSLLWNRNNITHIC